MSRRAYQAVLGAAIAATLLVGVGLVGLHALDGAPPVSVDQAVDRFRSAAPSVSPTASSSAAAASARPSAPSGRAPSARPGAGASASATPRAGASRPAAKPGRDGRPPEGVYVYRTTGYEEARTVQTARHDYPATTTITVRHSDCGVVGRWDATQDRYDETHECFEGAASVLTRYVSYHRFFGQEERKELTCGPRSYIRPPSTRAGYTWTFTCSGSGTTATSTGRVVGIETIAEGRALHVRTVTSLSGRSSGNETRDYWLATDARALLRGIVTVDAVEHTPFGDVEYDEHYDIRLTSRQPRR